MGSSVWLLNSKILEHPPFAIHPAIVPVPLLIKSQFQFDDFDVSAHFFNLMIIEHLFACIVNFPYQALNYETWSLPFISYRSFWVFANANLTELIKQDSGAD